MEAERVSRLCDCGRWQGAGHAVYADGALMPKTVVGRRSSYEEGSTNIFVDSPPTTVLRSATGRSSVRLPASGCGLVGGGKA
jgi:hypothetical protein